MPIQRIQPEGVYPSPRFSHVVKTGNTVYISGQTGRDAQGKVVAPGDAGAQTEQVMRNIQACLASVGGTLDDLVKINMYLTRPEQADRVREARARFFTTDKMPASTFVFVSGLVDPDLVIEIEAVAWVE